MRILTILLFSLLTACATNPDSEAHRLALWNFTYEKDKANELRIYDSISSPFAGDCEDFAFTLRRQIGGVVWLIRLEDRSYHAALVKNNLVYDNNSRRPIKRMDYHGRFIRVMNENKLYE